MPNYALPSLATLLAVISLAVHPYGSVAELKSAATAIRTKPASHLAMTMTGPRRHQVRLSTAPSVYLDQKKPTSRLEKILDESGVNENQRSLVGSVLSLLDDACLEKIETFSVLYNHPKHRGLAGKGVILVSGTVPDQELVGLLLHEGLGHFRDITCLTGTEASGVSTFRDGDAVIFNNDPSISFYKISWTNEKTRRADAQPEDFVTGYPYLSDNFEDLAESVTYYVTQEKNFRTRAAANPILAQKLAWLEQYMPRTKAIAETDAQWDGKIAWDATKLAFTWRGN